MIKNAMAYRLPKEFTLPENLNEILADNMLGEIDPQAASCQGWISPFGTSEFTIQQDYFVMLRFGNKEKVIPPGILNKMVKNQVKMTEERGGTVNFEQKQKIKEDLYNSCLPNALVKETETDLYFDKSNHLLIIDSATVSTADQIVSFLRQLFKTFKVRPLAPVGSGHVVPSLSMWLKNQDKLPQNFTLGNEVSLSSFDDEGATINASNMFSLSDHMAEHLDNGFSVSKLGLDFGGRVSFTLTSSLDLKKIRIHDVALDDYEVETVTSSDRLVPDFFMAASELKGVFAALLAYFEDEQLAQAS